MKSLGLLLILFAVATDAHAVVRCRLLYTPKMNTKGAAISNGRTFQSQGSTAFLSFTPDGVIRSASAQFQLDPAARTPGTGTLKLSMQFAVNPSNPSKDRLFETEFANYNLIRGDRVSKQVTSPNGQGQEDFITKPNPPPPPLTFKGPGDFPASSIEILKDQVVAMMELSCQNER